MGGEWLRVGGGRRIGLDDTVISSNILKGARAYFILVSFNLWTALVKPSQIFMF